jgi:hypothetical protein
VKRSNKLLVLISVSIIASTCLCYGLLKHFHNVNPIINYKNEYHIAEDWETHNGRGSGEYIITIEELSEGKGEIIISNFSDLGSDIKATYVNGSITIDTQKLATKNQSLVVYGTGTICEDRLHLTYSLFGGDTNFKANCVGQRLNANRTGN